MSLLDDLERRPKFLIFDIETAPSLVFTWDQWKTNVVATEKDWYMLAFAYKWLDEDEKHFVSLPDKKTWKPDSEDDKHVVRALWKLFEEADVVCAHNGDQFDIKKLQTRMAYHGFGPTSSFQSIDTLKLYRKHFNLYSYSLAEIARYFKFKNQKMGTIGFKVWRACMAGDPAAWAKMDEYNLKDVDVQEEAYYFIQPWVNRTRPNAHFNFAHFAEENANVCPSCGARDTLQRSGVKRTGVSEFPELWCNPKKGGCGARPQMRYRLKQYRGGVKAR